MIKIQRSSNTSRKNIWNYALFLTAFSATSVMLCVPSKASAHERRLKLMIGEKEVSLSTALYIDHSGVVFAPAELFEDMGYSTRLSSDERSMTIEDWRKSINWQTQIHDNHPMVPLAAVTSALNSSYNYNADNRTVTILAKIILVREDADKLSVTTSFPIPVHAQGLDNPNRVFLDITGATISSPKISIPVSGDDVSAVRAAQTTNTSVRIVVDLKKDMPFKQVSSAIPNHYELRLIGGEPSKLALAPIMPRPTIPMALALHHAVPTPQHVVIVNVPMPTLAADVSSGDDSGQSSNNAPQIENITYTQNHDDLTIYVDVQPGSVAAAMPYHAFLLDNPERLAFDIPGAEFNLPPTITEQGSNSFDIGSGVASKLRWGTSDSKAARLVLDLSHDVEYQISSSDINGGMTRYTIALEPSLKPVAIAALPNSSTVPKSDSTPKADTTPEIIVTPVHIPATLPTTTVGIAAIEPNKNTGAAPNPIATLDVNPPIQPDISVPSGPVPDSVLAGKTILLDPGHGGKDTGAPGLHGVLEKNVVLDIAKVVKDDLIACGAKVIMTRADDTFIPLSDRSQMGIDYHADYFVSVHADSSGVTNSHSGTTVYYHANNEVCRNLADAISQRLGQLDDGIKSDGVRSDFVRFPGVGFSVLRRSTEPAILVETGYVDSDNDCMHLTEPDTQRTIASAIVAGLKDYVAQGSGNAMAPQSAGASKLLTTIVKSAPTP